MNVIGSSLSLSQENESSMTLTLFEKFCETNAATIAPKAAVIQSTTALPPAIVSIITSYNPFLPVSEEDQTLLAASEVVWATGSGRDEIGYNFKEMLENDSVRKQYEPLLDSEGVLSLAGRSCLERLSRIVREALLKDKDRDRPELTQEDKNNTLLVAVKFNLLGRIDDFVTACNEANPNYVCNVVEEQLFPALPQIPFP